MTKLIYNDMHFFTLSYPARSSPTPPQSLCSHPPSFHFPFSFILILCTEHLTSSPYTPPAFLSIYLYVTVSIFVSPTLSLSRVLQGLPAQWRHGNFNTFLRNKDRASDITTDKYLTCIPVFM